MEHPHKEDKDAAALKTLAIAGKSGEQGERCPRWAALCDCVQSGESLSSLSHHVVS